MKPPKTSIDSFRTMARADISGSPTGAPQPVFRRPLQCRVILFAGDVNRFLATGDDTGGAFAQWEVVVPPGGGPRPHVHTREVESVQVLEGQIELDVGGVLTQAKVGDYVVLPIGVPHAFTNTSREYAVLLFTVAPAGLEQFFFEVGIEVPAHSIGQPARAADEHHQMLQSAPKYGIRFIDRTSSESA